jgi:hypothetical protein
VTGANGRRQNCRRPGCRRTVTYAQHAYCCSLCRGTHFEQTRSKKAALLVGLPVSELFPSIGIVRAALDMYAQELERVTAAAADEVGITPEAFSGVMAKPSRRTRRGGIRARGAATGRTTRTPGY